MGNQHGSGKEKKEDSKEGDSGKTGGKMRAQRARRNTAHITGLV